MTFHNIIQLQIQVSSMKANENYIYERDVIVTHDRNKGTKTLAPPRRLAPRDPPPSNALKDDNLSEEERVWHHETLHS